MHCIIMEKHSNQITHHDETNKRAHNSQIVRAKESLLDLHLSISNAVVSTNIYDKRDDFDFKIVNFPF